jgi:CheY-like chemotaxis protein/anti-sigma regulatory factor (Ser/Thr protein kinase)
VARNAAQATHGHGEIRIGTRIARQVTIARTRHRLALAVAIEDNGPGIAPELAERIFYPLVSGRDGGTGLGLSLAQSFVSQHQGLIEFESAPGRTRFTILLPVRERNRMNPVWIIDDDRSIRWVFEKALSREGIEHVTFGAAQEALDRLPGEAPQVVVSDIRMPGVSGLEFMQQLKSRLPATPVIIMTAYSDLESAVAAFRAGRSSTCRSRSTSTIAVELVRPRDRGVAPPGRGSAGRCRDAGDPRPGPAMQEVFRAIGRLAQSHATVMITGESGTGKELSRARCTATARAARRRSSPSTPRHPKDLA